MYKRDEAKIRAFFDQAIKYNGQPERWGLIKVTPMLPFNGISNLPLWISWGVLNLIEVRQKKYLNNIVEPNKWAFLILILS